MSRSITSPGDRRATFVELFFDLVSVFGVVALTCGMTFAMSDVGAYEPLALALAGVGLAAIVDERRSARASG